jgi:putative FmdB family regulatory protein
VPLYPYKCDACGHEFESIVKMSEQKSNQECPECGKAEGKFVEEIQRTVYSLGRSFSRMRHGK